MTKPNSARVTFAQLLARLDRVQSYNRLAESSLRTGRAAVYELAAELRYVGAALSPRERARALAAHSSLRPYLRRRNRRTML
jgi:hypothetical protein